MKRTILSLFTVILFNACSENKLSCENKVCTEQFVSINVKFLDSNGNPLVVKDYQSQNVRTGKLLSSTSETDIINEKGYYRVASDLNLKELSSSDKILVSAKHTITDVLKQAEFTVSGGECECHILKIAGPDEVRF